MSGRTATMVKPQTSGAQYCFTNSSVACVTACIRDLSPLLRSPTQFLSAQIRGINPRLPIHFTQNDVERSNDSHDVGHQMPARHLVERLQIDERRRANA